MRTRLRTCGLLCGIALVVCLVAPAWALGEVPERSRGDLSVLIRHLRSLVENPDPATDKQLALELRRAYPPAAILAVLEGLRAHPRPGLSASVTELTRHRQPAVRSLAFELLLDARIQAGHETYDLIREVLADRNPKVRSVGYASLEKQPTFLAQRFLLERVRKGELEAIDAFVACSDAHVIRNVLDREAPKWSQARQARLYGAILMREWGSEALRLALVGDLRKMKSESGQQELWIFARAELGRASFGPQRLARRALGVEDSQAKAGSQGEVP